MQSTINTLYREPALTAESVMAIERFYRVASKLRVRADRFATRGDSACAALHDSAAGRLEQRAFAKLIEAMTQFELHHLVEIKNAARRQELAR